MVDAAFYICKAALQALEKIKSNKELQKQSGPQLAQLEKRCKVCDGVLDSATEIAQQAKQDQFKFVGDRRFSRRFESLKVAKDELSEQLDKVHKRLKEISQDGPSWEMTFQTRSKQ
eukprot:TRINITY_DN28880_c0_g1_i1.p2 TRINITY_DN28880_c0_g1~~TRINITY_DN28880_c0_g1_i1.p2  ORF type:complete len:116 (-),score=32.76 TRINITY_DN28880_c0_g1_i1:600-947(-)